jgi:hypothetical protein
VLPQLLFKLRAVSEPAAPNSLLLVLKESHLYCVGGRRREAACAADGRHRLRVAVI